MARAKRRGRSRRPLAALAAVALVAISCGGGDAGSEPAGDLTADEDGGVTATDDDATATEDDAAATDDDAAAEDFGDDVTLTFGHPFPPTDPMQVNVWEPWVEEVREATGGTVDIEIHAGGALAPGPQVYENVVAGAQDLGWTMPGYTPGRFPITQIIEAPFVFDGAIEGTEVATELWNEFDAFQEEFSDTKVLSLWAMDTGDLFTRDTPVEQLEDLEGLTIRSPAPLQSQALEAMGANAVSMPGPDIYDAVERGVIDGYKLANSATRVFDLGGTTAYRTICNCYTGAFVLAMSQQAWDRLSPAQQDALESLTGPDLAMRLAEGHQGAADDTEATYWPENDVESIELDPEEFDRMRDAVQPVFDQWIQEMESAGVPGQEMADRLFELTGAN
ncbi:TRAP transporter substrate-binding protein [Egicoccus halophilus]|uniref:C4-dicarboxylate ABC transporter substrate-binding protein n=1 Tax=Egicoccus halophilus TaxID=1670830 RepID=A0A8J3A606_9ACTN|nr:TRAP transporter substrate-binding protein [Egicoccus halophilus]GGI04143.1 C4-dicarboxylate ABC transporter substrate-binding protein [Egicoccus halophilus]